MRSPENWSRRSAIPGHTAGQDAIHHHGEPGLQLVYGTHVSGDMTDPAEHRWVEVPGNITFDGTMQEFYKTSEYRRMRQATPRRRYTGGEAARLEVATGHTGPWTQQNCIDVLGQVPDDTTPATAQDAPGSAWSLLCALTGRGVIGEVTEAFRAAIRWWWCPEDGSHDRVRGVESVRPG